VEVAVEVRFVVEASVIVTDWAVDVLVLKLVSPWYLAVIDATPSGSVVVVSVARLLAPTVAVPSEVEPLKNSTDPVGAPEPGLATETVAVSETGDPRFAEVFETVRAVLVLACPTVTVVAAEVLVVKLASPEYFAVIELAPICSAGVERLATPEFTVAVPMLTEPAKNWTEPVGVVVTLESAEATVADSATDWPETEEVGTAEIVVLLPT
jgi:hypothetical protein